MDGRSSKGNKDWPKGTFVWFCVAAVIIIIIVAVATWWSLL